MAWASTLPAQTDNCLHRTVIVNVLDSGGQIGSGLRPENFAGSIHHKAIKIDSVRTSTVPPRILILVDASGSMTEVGAEWKQYMTAANWLVSDAPPGTSMALAVFTTEIKQSLPFTTDTKQIKEELERLATGKEALLAGFRKTALLDAIETVSSEFEPAKEGDTIYVLTDGFDNSSKTKTKTLTENLLNRGIRLFAYYDRDPGTPAFAEFLDRKPEFERLISDSGGTMANNPASPLENAQMPLAYKSGNISEAGALLLAQFRQIFHYQRVEIELPEALAKTENWSLTSVGLNLRDPAVLYPRALASCQ